MVLRHEICKSNKEISLIDYCKASVETVWEIHEARGGDNQTRLWNAGHNWPPLRTKIQGYGDQ